MKKNKHFFKDLSFLYKLVFQIDKWMIPITILRSIVSVSFTYVSIIYGALILDGLTQAVQQTLIHRLVIQMISISGTLLILKLILNTLYEKHEKTMWNAYENQLLRKHLTMDYAQLESIEIKQRLQEIKESINSNGGINNIALFTSSFVEGITSFLYSFLLIGEIFTIHKDVTNGKILDFLFNYPTLSTLLMVGLFLCVIANVKIIKKIFSFSYKFYEENIEANRLFGYFFDLASDYKAGKTFRIYGADQLIVKRMENYDQQMFHKLNEFSVKNGRFSVLLNLLSGMLMIASYLYIGIKAILGYIRVGAILSSVSAITLFFTSINQVLQAISEINYTKNYLVKLYDYLNLPSTMYQGKKAILAENQPLELEFKNVSFHYPNTKEMVLKNVSFKIEVGKKLAIVGPNGAGKSTFIKLLTRLYDPTEGMITLNGVNIKEYDYEQYLACISVVFQDFKLFSLSLKENVAILDENEEKVKKVLLDAGLEKRLSTLPDGLNTQLYQYNAKGVELSGGEAQKIAIARALYKDAPIVILDEPTAALDPISEEEIYHKFDTLVQQKTAIYISHRMSSCIFCNQIIVFNNGQIEEIGTHESLLQKQGLYFQMWNAQAKYYQS